MTIDLAQEGDFANPQVPQSKIADDERLEKMVRYIDKLGTKRWRAGVKYGENHE